MIDNALNMMITDADSIKAFREIKERGKTGIQSPVVRKYSVRLKESHHIDLGIGTEVVEKHILMRLAGKFVSSFNYHSTD